MAWKTVSVTPDGPERCLQSLDHTFETGNCTRSRDFANFTFATPYAILLKPRSEMGRELVAVPLDLIEVIEKWQNLAPQIVNAIMALIRSA